MLPSPPRGARRDGAWIAPAAAVVTVVVIVLGVIAPVLPVTSDEHAPWNLVQRALGFEAGRSVPGWWSTVLPVLVGVAAVDAAGRRASVAARAGWVLLGLLLGWLSLDHLVTIHEAVQVGGLGPVSGHPVEAALLVLGAVAAGLLVRSERRGTVVQLGLAAALYAASAAVDAYGVPVPLSQHHTAMIEVGLSWLALLVALRCARSVGVTAPDSTSAGAAKVGQTHST